MPRGISGSKTLIVYYVATPMRGYFASCTLSLWNKDRIEAEIGSSPLLQEAMALKEL